MRALNKRERRLIVMLSGAIFVIVNLFGVSSLFQRQGQLQSRLIALRNERREAKSWLVEKDMWQKRKEWLDKNQPKLHTTGEGNASLLETVQTTARKNNITIVEQGFAEPTPQPAYQEIAVKLKVSGTLESITRWLVELQQPTKFIAIPLLSMKSDSDATKVICELTVARWYAGK